jgi:DNA-directed RNA polymerase I subunit RPA49
VREEDTLQKHYVGVYDPKTGKLEVIEARKMEVRAAVRAHQATEEQVHKVGLEMEGRLSLLLTANSSSPQNALQSRIELGQLFGTKKARKAIASQSENAIGPSRAERGTATKLSATDSAVMSLMSAATNGMATAAELQEEADASKPRPKANLAATDVNDVYTPDNLLGVDMLKHIPIMDWTTAIAAKREIVVGSRHVAARIQREADNIVNLKLLRYMQLLIDFISATRVAYGGTRKLPKRDVLRDALGSSGGGAMPEAVVESVKRRFSTAGAMSRFQADLLITHVCALAMAVDHFEVGVYELQEDLKLEGREMAKYFREIGARVAPLTDAQRRAMKLDKAAGAQRQVAKLKIPLEFPKASAGRKKR